MNNIQLGPYVVENIFLESYKAAKDFFDKGKYKEALSILVSDPLIRKKANLLWAEISSILRSGYVSKEDVRDILDDLRVGYV